MSSWANNAISAKAKSIYGNFIKPEEYEKMAKFRSLSDFVGFLKKHENYREILKDVQESSIHRGNLEGLIQKNAFNQIIRLIKQVNTKDLEFYELDIVRQENEVILSAIRAMISEKFDENKGKVPYFFDIHTSIDLALVLKATNFSELIESLQKTPYYMILKPFDTRNKENIRYLDIEFALEDYYYDEAFRRVEKHYKGSVLKDLKSIFQTRIELSNIIKIYRLKKFYQADPATIKSILIKKNTRINEKKIDEIINLQNPDAILKYLSQSEFSRFTSDKDYVYVEYYAGHIRYDLAKKFMYFSTNVPKIYLAFVTLSSFEVENLTNIIEGIRYQINENEIKQMLIY
ncbi:MAG: V-type ATPase subunit [Acholeplasmataceae bacterium]|nr:V-type ATPase subunit [Acholeplasmataceae bacterium]